MFAGQFVLDVWTGSEYASFAVLKTFLPIQSFEIFLKCLYLKSIQLLIRWDFLKIYYINNAISINKARPNKRQKHVFAKQFSLLLFFLMSIA